MLRLIYFKLTTSLICTLKNVFIFAWRTVKSDDSLFSL